MKHGHGGGLTWVWGKEMAAVARRKRRKGGEVEGIVSKSRGTIVAVMEQEGPRRRSKGGDGTTRPGGGLGEVGRGDERAQQYQRGLRQWKGKEW